MLLPHETAGGVIEDGAHFNFDISPPLERLLQQDNHVLSFNTLAIETLCPFDQESLGQALLMEWEGESEAKGQDLILDFSVQTEIGKTSRIVLSETNQ